MSYIPPQLQQRYVYELVDESVLNELLERGQDVLNGVSASDVNPERRGRDLVALLRQYRERPLNKNGARRIKYKFKNGRTQGRLTSVGVSLQGLDRPIRHALCSNLYIDVDMCNAHPTLYSQLLRKFKRESPVLDMYVNEREDILAGVGARQGLVREDAKYLLLKSTYGGGLNGCKDDFCQSYVREMRDHHIFISQQFPDTYKFCRDNGCSYPESSCASMVIGAIENGVLRVIAECFEGVKIQTGTLMYDGLFVRDVPQGFLAQVEAAITEKTGYSVKLETKAMEPYNLEFLRAKYVTERVIPEGLFSDESSSASPEDARARQEDIDYFERVCDGDLGVAIELRTLYGHSLKNVGGDDDKAIFFRYDTETRLWKKTYRSDIMMTELQGLRSLLRSKFSRYEDLFANLDRLQRTGKLGSELYDEWHTLSTANAMCTALGRTNHIVPVMKLASSALRDDTFLDKLNSNAEIMSVRNGVLNLRTLEVREREKEDYLDYEIPYEYHANHPDKPAVEKLMTDATLAERYERTEYLQFLQEALGMACTGYDREEAAVFLVGKSGANCKGLIMMLLQKILGPMFYALPSNTLVPGRDVNAGAACPHLMKLRGIRCANIDECPDVRLDERTFKELTGGGKVSARQLYGTQEEFYMTHTIIVNCNSPPQFGSDPFIMRRVIACPFDAKFRIPGEADPEQCFDENDPTHFVRDNCLKDNIKQHDYLCAGFLSWVADGAQRYLARGRLPEKPDCCVVEADNLKMENDKIQQFIDEECVEELEAREPGSKLYMKFKSFMKPRRVMKKRDFVSDMERRGYEYTKCSSQGGVWCFKGVRYNTEEYER